MEDTNSIIYGLDYHARTLSSVTAEPDRIQFFIGTQSLKSENQVCVVELDEETNQISKWSYVHPCGEVWQLSASPADETLLATCYTKVEGNKSVSGCSVWQIDLAADNDEAAGNPDNRPLKQMAKLSLDNDEFVSCYQWQPNGAKKSFVLHGGTVDLIDSGRFDSERLKIVSSADILSGSSTKSATSAASKSFTVGKWNPHHNSNTLITAHDATLTSWDIRTMKETFKLEQANAPMVRDLDFNPNKQYILATTGDDSKIKFWDIRNTDKPIKVIGQHSHWVWCVRYNPIHDQLLLSCSSDARLLLHSLPSISSESSAADALGNDDSTSLSENESTSPALEDGLLSSLEEHEESVYCCAWSDADPWTYASLSYDGRLIINRVNRGIKYKILQL